ncbi:UNVERIFIED_CONTAM: Retrovirus-related Pol polyprotein from transposon TNT 1-94 [Sesamum calycinum]|uniref:Retrovirus-related Pol polyprotein from transposon TNT 1-94 n=1 Tax=Sesamum calycinum TaxID=2727403 RepID=A0AAW2JF84_9LAMI
MTRKPFVGQSKLANALLDLIHTDVCGPLNTQARGGFSYFITFTNDHSRYGYVYLMRYKSKAFVRFKEFRLEVENQTDRKIKTLRSNRGGEYLSGYALETAARLLNIAPSKTVAQTSYQIWHGKPASYKYLRVWSSPAYVKRLVGDKLDSRNAVFFERGFPTDTRHDELLLVESSEAPQSNAGTSSAPDVSTDNVLILRRSARVPQPPERYGFFGVTGQLDNDPKTYGEAMSDIDSGKWLEAMKFEMDSMSSNQVWTLVAKGYTQRPGVDFEKTFSPVAMAKSIRIMLAIAAWYDYEIWQMDVKTAFLNGFVEYQACAGEAHWTAVKTILKYLRRTKDVFLVYGGGELILESFINASFQSDDDDAKSQSGFVFKFNGGVVVWKSYKQDTIADSTTESDYTATSEAAKEVVWMKNYI